MAAKQFFLPYQSATINAVAEPGAQLVFYTSGTLNKLPIYATSALTTELSNPVVANSAGRFPNIYLNDALTYRLRILDRNGVELDDIDPFTPGGLLFDIATNAVTPQMYASAAGLGTLGLGIQDDSAAFILAIAALKAEALNTGGSGFYKGSRSLFIPAGHYFLGTTTLDINHTLAIQGEGSGQFGPGAGGCSRLRWAAGANGIRIQGPNTSGNTTVQADPDTHDGAGGVTLGDLCLEGGFAGTEGDFHGLVLRSAIKASNLYIKNWQGEGVKALAGNQTGGGTFGGNLSTTLLVGVKTEGCRGGVDIRGGDANVVTTINCEGYQNRWFGLLDDNGAGSNTHIGWHCASNGVVTGTWAQTQCSSSGNRYAAKWGGDPTVAPSGDTTDTANWLYIEAGAAITNLIPAHAVTAGLFRAGGDYLTINSASAILINPYSETGGFSQFNVSTQIEYGSIVSRYFRGGTQQIPSNDGGRVFKSGRLNCTLYLDTDGVDAGIFPRNYDGTGGFGYLDWVKSGGANLNGLNGCHFLHNNVAVGDLTNTGLSGVASVTAIGTGGVGYATGAGAAVTQITSRTTSTPAINKPCGQITLFSAAGTATWQTFTVPNTTVAATDVIRVVQASGTDKYMIHVTKVVAGTSFDVTFATTGGTTTETPVFNFCVIKSVAA